MPKVSLWFSDIAHEVVRIEAVEERKIVQKFWNLFVFRFEKIGQFVPGFILGNLLFTLLVIIITRFRFSDLAFPIPEQHSTVDIKECGEMLRRRTRDMREKHNQGCHCQRYDPRGSIPLQAFQEMVEKRCLK